jgi:hypothetical protein
VHAVAGPSGGLSEFASLALDCGKIVPSGRPAESQYILHYENPGLEEINVPKEFLIECPPWVGLHAFSVVRSVHSPCVAEALAGRSPNYDIDFLSGYQRNQIFRGKRREVPFEHIGNIWEILPQGLHGIGVRINRCEAAEAGSLHTKSEPTASAE